MILSQCERQFCHEGIRMDIRSDGRQRLQYRPLQIPALSSQSPLMATGIRVNPLDSKWASCRLSIMNGGCLWDIVCAVTVELKSASAIVEDPRRLFCCIDQYVFILAE